MQWIIHLLTFNAVFVSMAWGGTFVMFLSFDDLSVPSVFGWATATAAGCAGVLNAVLFGVLKGKGWCVPFTSRRWGAQCKIISARYVPLSLVVHGVALWAEDAYGPDAFVAPVLAGLAIAGVILLVRLILAGEAVLRGRQMRTVGDVKADARWLREDSDEGVSWGGVMVPSRPLPLHFLAVGATGSGKSLLMRLVAQSAFATVRTATGAWFSRAGQDVRALVYDAKLDQFPAFAGMKASLPTKTLHPFDARGVAWDIAADCTGPAVADQIADILIPDANEGQNTYFTVAARHLLSGVIRAYMMVAPGRFTFRDVVLATKDRATLVKLLSLFGQTRDRLEHFKEERTAQSVMSTLVTKMAPYDCIAAAWSQASEAVSLKQWAGGRMILLLGTDDGARSPLDAINRVLFKRATELTNALPDSPHRRTWFFLDETREAGKLDGLGNLMTKGRSKGSVAVLGVQSVAGFRAACKDDRVADEILGQCAHKALLRAESSETAEWSSKVLGEYEEEEFSYTEGSNSRSVTKRKVKRESVLPSEFLTIPPTTPANGLTGYFLAPDLGAYKNTISGDELSRILTPLDAAVPGFVPRPESAQVLKPWTDADLERLTLGHVLLVDAKPNTAPAPAVAEPKSRLQFVGQPEPQLG
jgi:Type IV secretion-system coupling protein DNA-binding domain